LSRPQQTIAKKTKVNGVGLFTGQDVTVTFLPARPSHGVVFVRTDLDEPVRIAAEINNVAKRFRRTALRNGTAAIETVEHCLAAVAGMQIDNILIELTAGELPGLDGSCQPFVRALSEAGIVQQDAPRKELIIREPVSIREGDAWIAALPDRDDRLTITYDLDYGENPYIHPQTFTCNLTPDTFRDSVAPSRTFVLENEIEDLRARGLGQRVTYKDVVVLGRNGVIDNELRFENECVRHKVVDLIGDLSLVGMDLRGRIVAYKSGHTLNVRMARKLIEMESEGEVRQLAGAEALLDIRQIMRVLPHRYPLLLVDRVIELDGDRKAVGIKNVTYNEQFFQGHYPGQPIMPGVLIVEAMAQLAGVLLLRKLEHTGKLAVLLSMDKVKIRKPVVPGDQLILEATTMRVKTRTGNVSCRAMVGNKVAAEAQIRFMLVDEDPAA
jgi:UDP-3-O-[3-hydroxymyristoyl] N-acetylglucosamine deacetylase/3-hydroxyacyl-[acyl-carrier-protein] dehydratase